MSDESIYSHTLQLSHRGGKLAPNWPRLTNNETNLGIFKISFLLILSHILILIIKSSRFVLFVTLDYLPTNRLLDDAIELLFVERWKLAALAVVLN